MFSDVGPMELLTLAVLAVLLFGPDKLPELIQNVMGFLRKVRQFSDEAEEEVRSELGPHFKDFHFKDFRFEDLNPGTFVRKRVLEGGEGLGLDEIRDALDPRREIAGMVDVVRARTDDEAGPRSAPDRERPAVSLEKAEADAARRWSPRDADVT